MEFHRLSQGQIGDISNDSAVLHSGQGREIHTLEGMEGTGHHFLRSGTGNHIAIEEENHIFRIRITGITHAVQKIHLSIGTVLIDRLLGSGDYNGLSGILHHVA